MNSRIESVDILRGLTVVAMILVNTPGTWAHIYPPLLHADWHGYTPTDLIFPFFLFLLTLIYYIPIDGFQEALMSLMQDTLPPKTYGAVEPILDDIIKNQNKGLLLSLIHI